MITFSPKYYFVIPKFKIITSFLQIYLDKIWPVVFTFYLFDTSDRVRFVMNLSCQMPATISSSPDLPQQVCEGFNDKVTEAVIKLTFNVK